MNHPLAVDRALRSPGLENPWRVAAVVAAAVAAVELVLLVVVGGALLVGPEPGGKAAAHKPHAQAAATAKPKPRPKPTPIAPAKLTRRQVSVLVLNGNGRQGAAAVTASRVGRHGYRIGGVANAPRRDYTRTLVMYRPGFAGEGYRLARDLGIGIVGPLDGLRLGELHGAHAVVVVGA